MTALYRKGDRHYIKFHIRDGLSVRKSIGLIRDSGLIDTLTLVAQEIKRMTTDRTFTEIRDLIQKAWAEVLVRHKRHMLVNGLYSPDAIAALGCTGLDLSHLGLSENEAAMGEPVRVHLQSRLPAKVQAMQGEILQGLSPSIDAALPEVLPEVERPVQAASEAPTAIHTAIPTAIPAAPVKQGLTVRQIRDYWDEFKEVNIRSGRWKLARSGQPQAQSRMNCLLKVGLDGLDDSHVFTKDDARRYRGTMLALPSRWYSQFNRGVSIEDIIAGTDADDCINADSVNQLIQAHGSFWKYCVDNDYCEVNVWDGLLMRLSKDQQGRKPIEPELIPQVLETSKRLDGWKKILPILGLYTGARIAELAQLSVHDIDIKAGTIRIDDKVKGQRVKNTQSRRVIPIPNKVRDMLIQAHSDALAAIDRGDNPDGSLWVGLNGQTLNHRAVTAGASTNRWLRKLTGESFHALRHTFATSAVQAGVELELVKAILGHSHTGTTLQVYARYSIEQMQTAIDTLPY